MIFKFQQCNFVFYELQVINMSKIIIYMALIIFIFPITNLKNFSLCNVIQEMKKVWPYRDCDVEKIPMLPLLP